MWPSLRAFGGLPEHLQPQAIHRDYSRAAAVRASVERGEPLIAYGLEATFGVAEGLPNPWHPGMPPGLYARFRDGTTCLIEPATVANGLKADPPQPVTADTQTFDTEANRDYSHGVSAHEVQSAPDERTALAGEAIEAAWSEQTRLAFLARVQRIDHRERRP